MAYVVEKFMLILPLNLTYPLAAQPVQCSVKVRDYHPLCITGLFQRNFERKEQILLFDTHFVTIKSHLGFKSNRQEVG